MTTPHPKPHNNEIYQESDYECPTESQIKDWENEGGAGLDWNRPVHRDGGLKPSETSVARSVMSDHLMTATRLMDAGEIDAACEQMEAAASRLMSYRETIDVSLQDSITRLTTLGCRATPPHPKALALIRLRQKITA